MKHRIIKARNKGLSRLENELTNQKYEHTSFILLLDSSAYQYCLPQVLGSVSALHNAEFLEIESGESSKDIAIITQLWESLLEMNADKQCVLITLGGGVVSDIGGFLAATYKRGINHIHIPTTLMGMIDAAIGGKNGININQFKNAVGCFHEPLFTFIYPPFTETLSHSALLSGAAEMVKIALVADPEMWKTMQHLSPIEIAKDEKLIYRCADLKQKIVSEDPKEQNKRKILNFGHSIGHALESLSLNQKEPITHGHAVAQGMYYAVKLSATYWLSPSDAETILNFIEQHYPLTPLNEENYKDILYFLNNDKKNRGEHYRFILLKDIGNPVIDVPVKPETLADLLLNMWR